MKQCAICGKGPVIGHRITKRGMSKKEGGVGRKNVRVNLRRFLPNLQPATVILNGVIRRARVCTACLKSGRVIKAPLNPSRPAVPA